MTRCSPLLCFTLRHCYTPGKQWLQKNKQSKKTFQRVMSIERHSEHSVVTRTENSPWCITEAPPPELLRLMSHIPRKSSKDVNKESGRKQRKIVSFVKASHKVYSGPCLRLHQLAAVRSKAEYSPADCDSSSICIRFQVLFFPPQTILFLTKPNLKPAALPGRSEEKKRKINLKTSGMCRTVPNRGNGP